MIFKMIFNWGGINILMNFYLGGNYFLINF